MGQVFLARQESLDRLVALKVCKPETANDDRLRARFETEGQALAQLRHPHVVPVIMTGEHEGLEASEQELQALIDQFGLNLSRGHAMAKHLQRRGQIDNAEELLKELLEDDAGGVTSAVLGDLAFGKKRWEQAIGWYRRAIREGMSQYNVYLSYADAATAVGDLQEAERLFQECLQIHAEEPDVFCRFAHWYEDHGRLAEAEDLYLNFRSSQTSQEARCRYFSRWSSN